MINQISGSKIKYTVSFPTSLVVSGLNRFGYELARSLTNQGGYVIIVDDLDKELDFAGFEELDNIAFIDYTGIPDLVEDIRRLDYVFYLNHQSFTSGEAFSSQEMLSASSYLNQILNLTADYDGMFTLVNSLRAHKSLIAQAAGFNVNRLSTVPDYLSYTEVEFLRYSESLVLEYIKTRRLQGKILRIGELLGEGVELDRESNVGKLVWPAVTGEDLYLDGDGLKAEYYVHLLDAVYGVLKAQFSKGLTENIYTLAYPEPLTQLSLAFKLQELEPEAGEIKFLEDEGERLTEISGYQAAINLTEIGWQPKIGLEKALLQTIAFTRKLLRIYADIEAESGRYDRLESTNAEDQLGQVKNSVLNRLIAERKRNQSAQKVKYNESMEELQSKKKRRDPQTRLRRSVIKTWDGIASNFKFLSNLSLVEAGVYLGLLSVFGILFFAVLAPLVNLGFNLTTLRTEVTAISSAAEQRDWEEVQSRSRAADGQLDSISQALESSQFLFELIAAGETNQALRGVVQQLEFELDASENLASVASDIEALGAANRPDLVVRPTNTSVLSVNRSAAASTDVNAAELVSGVELSDRSFANADRVRGQLDSTRLPQVLLDYTGELESELATLRSFQEPIAQSAEYWEQLGDSEITVGLIIRDNLQSTFGGGKVVGLGLFEYANGNLVAANLSPASSFANADEAITEVDLTSIELAEITSLLPRDLGIDDLEPTDYLDYTASTTTSESVATKLFSANFSETPGAIWTINLVSFEDLLEQFGAIEINNQQLTNTTYLSGINILQGQSLSARENLITNASAVLLANLLGSDELSELERLALIGDVTKSGGFTYTGDLADVFSEPITEPELRVAFAKSEPENFTVNPTVDLKFTAELATSSSADQELVLNTANAADVDSALFCLPPNASGLDFGSTSVLVFQRVEVNDRDCALFTSPSATEFSFSYEQPRSNREYSGVITVSPGIQLRLDLEVIPGAGAELLSSVPTASQDNSEIYYFSEVYNQFKFNLSLSN